jgi:FkbM family methyltransferase
MRNPFSRSACSIRCPSSDVVTYSQVFLEREYEFRVHRPPQVIIDAGANIGLASVLFATRFPEARIIAIEPEDSNVEMLRLNTRNYPNVTVLQAALWGRDQTLHVIDRQFGKWGFMTASVDDPTTEAAQVTQDTHGISVASLLREQGIDRVDIFKIDIEGAEKELFEDCEDWIGRVDALIVELHDRMKPGCADAFEAAVRGFPLQWQQGENEFRVRRGTCLKAPTE